MNAAARLRLPGRADRAAAAALCLAATSLARADHGADPADELSLPLMIAVAVAVGLAALIVRRIRNGRKQRPPTADRSR